MGRLKFLMTICKKNCGEFRTSIDNCKHLHPNFSYQHMAKIIKYNGVCPIYCNVQYTRIKKLIEAVKVNSDHVVYLEHHHIKFPRRLRNVAECLNIKNTDITYGFLD